MAFVCQAVDDVIDGRQARALGNQGNIHLPPDEPFPKGKGRQAWAYALLFIIRWLLRSRDPKVRDPSVCFCSRFPRKGQGGQTVETVTLGRRPSGGTVLGLQRCGMSWVCPVCAPGLARVRVAKTKTLIDAARRVGLPVAVVTLTVSHDRRDPLQQVYDDLHESFTAARNGNAWQRIRKEAGGMWLVLYPEYTYSRTTGHHPHVHVLAFGGGSADQLLAGCDEMVSRFVGFVSARGRRCEREAQDVRPMDTRDAVAAYLAKIESWEAAGGSLKDARGRASLSAWDLARLSRSEPDKGQRFREYAATYRGEHSARVTKALRQRLGLSEAELLALDEADDDDPEDDTFVQVGVVAGDVIKRVIERGFLPKVIDCLDTFMGWTDLAPLIASWGAEDAYRRRPSPPGQLSFDDVVRPAAFC